MSAKYYNKRKIFNDPVYGFINIHSDLIFDLIEHPLFQRLRRIHQLGITHMVYPGTHHTRFQHALGTYHLTSLAIQVIRSKGHDITSEEEEATCAAALLHDIGHGPFSHALELCLIEDLIHEDFSLLFMEQLNKNFDGKLSLAIQIFKDQYPKKFLHQLISSQLDMDRMDYLKRDCFFSGVSEGEIGTDRIIKMLEVVDDQLVVESKGIYSIENFLIARRLMYWQVYLHKTAISAETVLIKMLKRARYLAENNSALPGINDLNFFLQKKITKKDLFEQPASSFQQKALAHYAGLDDSDILFAAKKWMNHNDQVLKILAGNFINRKLFKIEIQNEPFKKERIEQLSHNIKEKYQLYNNIEASYFVITDSISNYAYSKEENKIKILFKNGEMMDIDEASDMVHIAMLSKTIKKHYLCFPKELDQKNEIIYNQI